MCFDIKSNSYFPKKKKLNINPNQSYKRKREDFVMEKKIQYQNTFFIIKKIKKPLTLIRVIRNNENPPKENREREYSQFVCGKNMD